MITGKVPSALAPEIKKFTKKVKQEVLAGINPYTYLIRIDVAPVAPGEDFIPIKGLKLVSSGEDAGIEAKEGEILVLTFTASWCEASFKISSDLNALAKVHLSDKARFISINLDDSLDTASNLVKEHGWDTIECINIGSSSSDLTYGASMIPRVVFSDAHGKLAYIGHPKKLDLSKAVNTLLTDKPLELEPELLKEDDFSADTTFKMPEGHGVFKETEDLGSIREEMEKFSAGIIKVA